MMRAGNRSDRAVLGGLLVWVVLLGSLGFAASSNAQQFDYYLIFDGPGAGVRLITLRGQLTVLSFYNQPGTAGDIGQTVEGHCNDVPHFHGSIAGLEDPDPAGCGWGKVAKVAPTTPLQVYMSRAILNEFGAQCALGTVPPDYAAVIDLLRTSMSYLDFVKSEVAVAKDRGQVDQRAADRITRQIDVAKKTEQQALDALTRLKNGNGEPKDRQAAERDIRIALEDKARVFLSLRKANLSP
jgi:hypothetical protein